MYLINRGLPNTDLRNKEYMDFLVQNDHKCSIDSNDILQEIFKGKGVAARLRRWWHDLLLVSYRNQDARLFYLGTFAMRSHRRNHFLSYKYIIHPWSKLRLHHLDELYQMEQSNVLILSKGVKKFSNQTKVNEDLYVHRAIWNFIMMLSVVFNILTFSYTTSPVFSQNAPDFVPYLIVCECIILSDIIVNFQSGYVDTVSKTVVLERNKILKHYMSTAIFMHALTAIPLQVILTVVSLQSDQELKCLNSVFICVLRALHVFRTVRLWKMTDCWKLVQRETLSSSIWYVKVLKTLTLCIGTMIQVSHLGDTITLLEAHYMGYLNSQSFIAYMLIQKYIINIPLINLIFLSKARLFKKFVISSHGFYLNRRPVDRMSDLTNYFLGAFFSLWCLLEVTTYLHRCNYSYNQKMASMDEAKCLIQSRRLTDRLKDRIHKYYNYIGVDSVWRPRKNKMFIALPERIRNQITIETKHHVISNIQCFTNWPPNIIDKLTLALDMQIYLEGDTVASNLIVNDRMIIVVRGVLAIYSLEGAEDGRLADGQHFGAIYLVTEEDMAGGPNIIAVTDAYVALLHKRDFRNIITNHSSLYDSLKNQLISGAT